MISPNPDVIGFILAWLLPNICQLGEVEQLKEGKQKELCKKKLPRQQEICKLFTFHAAQQQDWCCHATVI